jgi:hypothetical protein
MRGKVRYLSLCLAAVTLFGCKVEGFAEEDAAVTFDARPRPDGSTVHIPVYDAGMANAGVVPQVGSATTLDIGCWNVENFPKKAGSPVALADLIASMDLDIVAVSEINDQAAFDQVKARLPGWNGVLGSGNHGTGGEIPPQRLGFFWKESAATLTSTKPLFTTSSYEFPRPPFQATVTAGGKTFTLITVHLKAGISAEDQARRQAAHVVLEGYMRTLDGPVLLCGDFNQEVYGEPDAGTGTIYAPYLADSARYRMLTAPLDRAGGITFLDYSNMLDQMIGTSGLDSMIGAAAPLIPQLDDQYSPYESVVSDHLPVVLRLTP